MSRRDLSFLKETVLVATAWLFTVSPVLAGEHVRAGDRATTRSQYPSVSIPRALPLAQSISVVVTAASQAATEPLYVDIRSPDGQMRRFPVEGGRATIQYRQAILHPGDMLTIRWAPTK